MHCGSGHLPQALGLGNFCSAQGCSRRWGFVFVAARFLRCEACLACVVGRTRAGAQVGALTQSKRQTISSGALSAQAVTALLRLRRQVELFGFFQLNSALPPPNYSVKWTAATGSRIFMRIVAAATYLRR